MTFQNTEYFIGYCHGKFEVNIPCLSFFKTYDLGELNNKTFAATIKIAEGIIKNKNNK